MRTVSFLSTLRKMKRYRRTGLYFGSRLKASLPYRGEDPNKTANGRSDSIKNLTKEVYV
jgi:hypothetical protein